MSYFKRQWSYSEIERLIRIYETKRCLWDDNFRDYKNRNAKDEALTELAIMFNTNVEEIRRKIHNLRNQFSCEVKKSSKKSAQGTNENLVSRWPYFKPMMFLIKRFSDRPQIDNLCKEEVCHEGGNVKESEEDLSGSVIFEEYSRRVAKESNGSELKLNGKRKKHLGCSANRLLLKKAISRITEQKDDCDIFGTFIASELRSLRNEYLKRKMKLSIQQIVLEICEKDNELVTAQMADLYSS